MILLELEETVSTPKVFIDKDRFSISGETRPENPRKFYDQVFDALNKVDELLADGSISSYEFLFDLEYISTSSLVMLKKLFNELRTIQDKYENVTSAWLYYEMDEGMKLLGEELRLITKVDMEVKQRP